MTELTTASRSGLRRVAIDPLTRVEGHGKVTLLLDEAGAVQQARLHIVEFRGFEVFIRGRPFWEVPVAVQRLCGICPVSHLLAASKAMDRIVGAPRVPPTAEKVRRLMHYGQMLQSHALHFYYLASPDLLFGFDCETTRRNIVGVATAHPELARHGVLLRKFGQELIHATAGKRIHGTGSVPGGVNRSLSRAERTRFLSELPQIVEWCEEAVGLVERLYEENAEFYREFASFPAHGLSLVRADGAVDLYDGRLRCRSATGEVLLDDVDPADYDEHIGEEVAAWSYMKFPYLRALGATDGWYRVGPLARLTGCDCLPSPRAEARRQAFLAADDGRACHATLAYHWARMIEMLHAAEVVGELLADDDLSGDVLRASGERQSRGIGVLEAPRGTLIHDYVVDAHDQVVSANLVVSTTHNNTAMNRAILAVAQRELAGQAELTEPLLNHVEVAIRAFDPCLSCATHALGQMPLVVELADAGGRMIARRERAPA